VISLIRTESIHALIAKNKDDTERLDFLNECLLSFSEYHACIYKAETWKKLYGYHNMPKDDFQTQYAGLDRSRSLCHDAVIGNIGILNRLCQEHNIPPVYAGPVSKERPYRVEIADAVLDFVETAVKNRPK
jgi:hypothetical protein